MTLSISITSLGIKTSRLMEHKVVGTGSNTCQCMTREYSLAKIMHKTKHHSLSLVNLVHIYNYTGKQHEGGSQMTMVPISAILSSCTYVLMRSS